MARKLKTYTTSIGFYDLAVAAPSMKAALEAWGANQNLFHQGLAEETEDADIVAATMAKPGIVLRRAVGTSRPYQEVAVPPKSLPASAPRRVPPDRKAPAVRPKVKPDAKGQRAAVISFERVRAEREKARRAEDAQRAKEQEAAERDDKRRQRAAAKARSILDRARERHAAKVEMLEKERRVVEDRLAAEQDRWDKEERQLERNIRDAEA